MTMLRKRSRSRDRRDAAAADPGHHRSRARLHPTGTAPMAPHEPRPLRGCAPAARTASNETLVQKRLTILGRSTDGPAEAVSLRAQAASLRDQYKTALGSNKASFGWAEQITGPFTFDERLLAERLRQSF